MPEKRYCKSCHSLVTKKSNFCWDCFARLRKGSNHPSYKIGKYTGKKYCMECNKEITFGSRSGLCRSCSSKRRMMLPENNPMFGVRRFGKDNPNYIDGRSSITQSIKTLDEYKSWRNQCLKKDNYICQECFSKDNLEIHHLFPFSKLISEFLNIYSQFSPEEDKETLVRLAITYTPFWDINNGQTLCKSCHTKTFKGVINNE